MSLSSVSVATRLVPRSSTSVLKPRLLVRPFSATTTPPSPELEGVPKVVVIGGNGYVGRHVVQSALLNHAAEVASINRSGAPNNVDESWVSQVKWVSADVFDSGRWVKELEGATGVVSCVGPFGSNEFMERVCGDANIHAVKETAKAGVKRFVFISTAEGNLPDFVLKGYFHGKKRAEEAVLEHFPKTGVILQPGFIYGTRAVGNMKVPLALLGRPLETLFRLPPFPTLQSTLPFAKGLIVPPVPVEAVGSVAASAAMGETPAGKLRVDDIVRLTKKIGNPN